MNKEKINKYKTEYEAKYLSPEFKENGIIYTAHSLNPSSKDMIEMIVEAYQFVESCTPFDSDEVYPEWSFHQGTDGKNYKNLTMKLYDYVLYTISRKWNQCIDGGASTEDDISFYDEYELIGY